MDQYLPIPLAMMLNGAIRCLLFFGWTTGLAVGTGAWNTRYEETGIIEVLRPRLSERAHIVLRGEDGFVETTARWQVWKGPDVAAVVEVRTEGDVGETIRYANEHKIPFFAQSGGYGVMSSLAKFKGGIQINMRGLNDVSIAPDGESATFGGGVKVKEVTDALWAHGKQTVTGVSECIGHTATVLGGGHGILQGFHGLLSDQVLSARIVLANSTAVTASPTSNPDLFWALRGAGHNFGIVTSLQYKIYDIEGHPGGKTWSHKAFAFPATADNVKRVYAIAESQIDSQPEGMFQSGLIMNDPNVSKEPIILHNVYWNGPLTSPLATKLTQPYHDLTPLAVAKDTGTYLDVAQWMQSHAEGPTCNLQRLLPGAGVIRFPVDVQAYDLKALTAAVEKFLELVNSVPEFSGSFFAIEQYATYTVRDFASEDSAFASRDARVLLVPTFFYPSIAAETGERNKALDKMALQYGQDIRGILVKAAAKSGGAHSYVNYAFGGEGEKAIYGKDKIGRLRALKGVYDPENRFGFYAPIKVKKEGHSEL